MWTFRVLNADGEVMGETQAPSTTEVLRWADEKLTAEQLAAGPLIIQREDERGNWTFVDSTDPQQS